MPSPIEILSIILNHRALCYPTLHHRTPNPPPPTSNSSSNLSPQSPTTSPFPLPQPPPHHEAPKPNPPHSELPTHTHFLIQDSKLEQLIPRILNSFQRQTSSRRKLRGRAGVVMGALVNWFRCGCCSLGAGFDGGCWLLGRREAGWGMVLMLRICMMYSERRKPLVNHVLV